MRRAIQLLMPVAVVFLLFGCLDSSTTVTIRSDGSGLLTLEYVIERVVFETGVFNSDGLLPIPVAEDDFVNATTSVDGIALRRYRLTEDDDTVTVRATITFDTTDALVTFLGDDWISIVASGDTTTWRQLLVPARSGAEGSAYLAEDLDQYTLRFEIDPDEPITSVQGGTLLRNGDAAVAEVSLGAIVRGAQAQYLEVVW